MQSNADGIKTRRIGHFSLLSRVYYLICACLKRNFYADLLGVATSGHVTTMAVASFDPP